MKRKYRIRTTHHRMFDLRKQEGYVVEMHNGFYWQHIKEFYDEDMDFAKREAEELLEKLNEK